MVRLKVDNVPSFNLTNVHFNSNMVRLKDEKNPNGDINLGPAVDLIYFAAKDAAVSLKKDPDAITVEQVEDWVEDLGFIDFITEAIEFAAERFTDQQNHSSGGTAKKKKSPSAK
jgi:hypothetical protein